MYTIERYLDNITLLTSSLVIKHHDIGIIMNKGLFSTYGTVPPDNHAEWKYYLNLSGVKHSTNNDITIVIIETGESVLLTKDILVTYPATHAELDSRLNSYKALMTEYPDDHIYINGCINPVDINTAINAVNGTVLSYSKQYVEPQEYSLIRELSSELKLYLGRWYIRDYNITDELYMAAVLSVMYINIPNMVAGIRLRDSYTSEANSFHIEHFFRSHLDLWDNVRGLKQTTIRWLYRNLVSIINNVGSNETFNTIVSKVFDDNGIGLANYILKQDTLIANNSSDPTVPALTLPPPVFGIKLVTPHYRSFSNKISLADVIKTQVLNSEYNRFDKAVEVASITESTTRVVGSLVPIEQPTKLIDFGDVSVFKNYTNSLLETILDNWLLYSSNNKYRVVEDFVDPNTMIRYNIDSYSGILLLYYLMFQKLGINNPTTVSIRYNSCIRTYTTRQTLVDKLLNSDGVDYVAGLILDRMPNVNNTTTSVSDFTGFIQEHIKLYTDIWAVDSNVNNAFLSSNIKQMAYRITRSGRVVITNQSQPDSLLTILNARGVNIDTSGNYDHAATMSVLLKTFTGFDISDSIVIGELYSNLEVLLEKLTSYSIQTIGANVGSGDIKVPHASISVTHGSVGYVAVTDATTVKILEDNNSVISGAGNDFVSDTIITNSPTIPSVVSNINDQIMLHGYHSLSDVDNSVVTKGRTFVEILGSGYLEYAPGNVIASNDFDGVLSTSVVNNSPGINVTNIPTSNDVQATATNTTVTASTNTTTEILGSDYNI